VKRLSSFLLGLGVVVGMGGALGLVLGTRSSSFRAQLLGLSAYTLVFVAAGCALAAGAMFRRAAVQREALNDAARTRAQFTAGGARSGMLAHQPTREREPAG
jgi:uncharacterized membrane protein YedE/YeeE